jgi:N-acetylmuramoyl-L-alanine amidase
MKKLFNVMITITLVIGSYIVFPTTQINAQAEDSIQTGDTLKLLWEKYDIEKVDSDSIDLRFINEEEKAKISKSLVENKENSLKDSNKEDSLNISNKEKKLLARLVHAEAKGEPFEGKVAVATVVLNRVEHKEFPDTVKEVIYEENAFEPVQNGSINESADKEAHQAVNEALADQENNDELLYFYNPETATSDWILTREVVKTIGDHAFAI